MFSSTGKNNSFSVVSGQACVFFKLMLCPFSTREASKTSLLVQKRKNNQEKLEHHECLYHLPPSQLPKLGLRED